MFYLTIYLIIAALTYREIGTTTTVIRRVIYGALWPIGVVILTLCLLTVIAIIIWELIKL